MLVGVRPLPSRPRKARHLDDAASEPAGGHRAHGFTSGRAELAAWPRSEIFAFAQDVRCYRGDLASLLPEVTREDVVDGARLAVAGLYHLVAHTLMGEQEPEAHRQGLQKMLFFALQQTTYLRCGIFPSTRAELLNLIDDDEATLLTGTGEPFFTGTLDWMSRTLRNLGQ